MAKIPSSGGGSKYERTQVEPDTYEARITKFLFIGAQPQRPFQGKPKPDALMAKVTFELIGETVTVTNTEDGTTEQQPALVFNDIVVPGGGTGRGKCFDLINAALDAEECFDDTEDYKALINAPVSVKVGEYENKKTGKMVACVDGVSSMGKRAKEKLEDSTSATAFFDCYADDEDNKEVYQGMGDFIQKKIKEAKDAQHIPAIQNDWPTTKPEEGSEGGDEF